MTTELTRMRDSLGGSWRLALEDHASGTSVELQLLYAEVCTEWVRVAFISHDPERAGVISRSKGVLILDDRRAKELLVELMRQHNAQPSIGYYEEGAGAAPPEPILHPVVDELADPACEYFNLMQFVAEAEATLATLTEVSSGPGRAMWSSVLHKLRESCYLLQDLSRALETLRGEIDHLSSPRHRTPQYAQRIDMFDRWITALRQRCANYPTIQVPRPTTQEPGRAG